MIIRTMQTADAVLAIVDSLSEDLRLHLQPYQNGREHGWSLIADDLQVAFSQNRNSDSIVVYTGRTHSFATEGNVPDDSVYKNRRFFDYDNIYGVAQAIVDYLA